MLFFFHFFCVDFGNSFGNMNNKFQISSTFVLVYVCYLAFFLLLVYKDKIMNFGF